MKIIQIFLLLLISSKAVLAQDLTQKQLRIVVSINPIYQILSAISKDLVHSDLIIDPTISEHDYQLKKSDVAAVSKADLIFYIDDSLEHNFAKLVKNRNSYKLIDIPGMKLLHKRDGSKRFDPHIWLNPENAIKIAEFMVGKISEIDAVNSQKYQKNLIKFKDDILREAQNINSQAIRNKESNYIFYHDGYYYFEDYFGLKPLKVIASHHDRDLGIKDAREIDLLAKEGKIKCFFGDIYSERNSAQKLAKKYHVKFAALNLIGEKGVGYRYLLLKLMRDISDCIE